MYMWTAVPPAAVTTVTPSVSLMTAVMVVVFQLCI
jgi:hypothetical protein